LSERCFTQKEIVQIELAFAVGKWDAAFMAGDFAIALQWSGFVSDQLIQRLAIWARKGFENHANPSVSRFPKPSLAG
jgi:hypothetical protein